MAMNFFFIICFSLFEVYVVFSYERFGPRKELFGFIVNLYFIWYFKSNVQGMNCFGKKKILCIKAMGVLGLLGILVFFFVNIFFGCWVTW